jgi:ribonuclease D
VLDRRGRELLAAIARGLAVPEGELPKFPRAPRWEKDPQFDERVSRLRLVREAAARRLDLDPGVLAPRERLEAIARAKPASLEALAAVPGLRRWQAGVLGREALRAVVD